MESNKKKNLFVRKSSIAVLIFSLILCVGLEALKLTQDTDYSFYDSLLGVGKSPEANEKIVLLDIGDRSLSEYGEWPWSRDILGDALLRLYDLGAKTAVFDIEYLIGNPLSVSKNIQDVSEELMKESADEISWNFGAFTDYMNSPSVSKSEAMDLIGSELENSIGHTLNNISDTLYENMNIDYDNYFAQAIQFFGNASMTINMKDVNTEVTPEEAEYAKNRFLFSNVVDPSNLIPRDNDYCFKENAEPEDEKGFVPAINKIVSRAAGAGFTNVVVDTDGIRRRIELLNLYDGKYVGQLSFAPLIRELDVKQIVRGKRSLTLKDALNPVTKERSDIRIPLDDHGRMLINWLHDSYWNSFKHVEVCFLKYLDDSEASIYYVLSNIRDGFYDISEDDENGFVNMASGFADLYENIQSQKDKMLFLCEGFNSDGTVILDPYDGSETGISIEDYEIYKTMRQVYFGGVTNFVSTLSTYDFPEGDLKNDIDLLIEQTAMYNENYGLLKNILEGGFCIIGNSATASTDLGITPFNRKYPNVGTHANVVNTIIQKSFVTYLDPWWALAFSFVLALVVLLLVEKKTPPKKIIFGLVYLLVPIILFSFLMIFARIYVPFTSSLIMVIITYLFSIASGFVATERDKNTLRRGFDAYVAPEVVSEIVKNPQLLALGGSNRKMTALFSDVRTFSGFTECINKAEGEGKGAARLVEILNGYLGVLSDAIMAERGTIDKYVGDEIVSFFGAPIENPNNAFDACVAGIRMKQAEDLFNQEHLGELPIHPVTGTPFLLKSRVGINTGDMVVGNMGTSKKLNYTIMGNNVNLASRLEGTNKAYDSWIMASESTWMEANSGANQGKLVAKMLDCVRVVNVEKPVQIYSIQGLRSELTSAQIEGSELFNAGMEFYLKGRENPEGEKDLQDFMKAKNLFEQAYKCYHTSDDQDKTHISTEKKMILRCENFLINGLPVDENGIIKPWDGVYTMTSK